MRDKFIKFMYGRYGVDELSKSMLIVSVVLSLLGTVFRFIWWLSLIFLTLSLAIMGTIIYRMLSRNINKRVFENHKFLAKTGKIRNKAQFLKTRFRDRKTHKYVKCPNCKNYSRVPKGKGKIKITCRVCKKQYERKV